MSNSIDLKAVWRNAPTESLPDSENMRTLIKLHRNKQVRKFIWLIISAVATVLVMVYILFSYKNATAMTIAGGLLIIMAGMLLVATNLNSLHRFYKLKACSNMDYLAFLQHTKVRQLFYYKYTQAAVMLLTVVGMYLYSYHALHTNFKFTIIVLSSLGVYFLLMWFYMRPLAYKKGAKKLNKEIEKAKRIAQQLKNNNEEEV